MCHLTKRIELQIQTLLSGDDGPCSSLQNGTLPAVDEYHHLLVNLALRIPHQQNMDQERCQSFNPEFSIWWNITDMAP